MQVQKMIDGVTKLIAIEEVPPRSRCSGFRVQRLGFMVHGSGSRACLEQISQPRPDSGLDLSPFQTKVDGVTKLIAIEEVPPEAYIARFAT